MRMNVDDAGGDPAAFGIDDADAARRAHVTSNTSDLALDNQDVTVVDPVAVAC